MATRQHQLPSTIYQRTQDDDSHKHAAARVHNDSYMLLLFLYPILSVNSFFAIYQILLGWKTGTYYYETDELPNPRPTQSKKTWVENGVWPTFFPQEMFFRGLGLILCRKQTTRNPTQPIFP